MFGLRHRGSALRVGEKTAAPNEAAPISHSMRKGEACGAKGPYRKELAFVPQSLAAGGPRRLRARLGSRSPMERATRRPCVLEWFRLLAHFPVRCRLFLQLSASAHVHVCVSLFTRAHITWTQVFSVPTQAPAPFVPTFAGARLSNARLWASACLCVCVCACLHECAYMCTCVRVHVCVLVHACSSLRECTRVCMHMHVCVLVCPRVCLFIRLSAACSIEQPFAPSFARLHACARVHE